MISRGKWLERQDIRIDEAEGEIARIRTAMDPGNESTDEAYATMERDLEFWTGRLRDLEIETYEEAMADVAFDDAKARRKGEL